MFGHRSSAFESDLPHCLSKFVLLGQVNLRVQHTPFYMSNSDVLCIISECSLRRQNVVILPGCTEKVAVCSGTCGTGHSFLYYSLDPETKQTMKNSRCLCCRDTKLRRREIQCNGKLFYGHSIFLIAGLDLKADSLVVGKMGHRSLISANNTAMQRQTAVTAHLKSKQLGLLLFAFANSGNNYSYLRRKLNSLCSDLH